MEKPLRYAAALVLAKRRWRTHTERVLTAEARQSFRVGKVWLVCDDIPYVVSADRHFVFHFDIQKGAHGQPHVVGKRGLARAVDKDAFILKLAYLLKKQEGRQTGRSRSRA